MNYEVIDEFLVHFGVLVITTVGIKLNVHCGVESNFGSVYTVEFEVGLQDKVGR